MKFPLLTFTALVLLACEMPTKRAVFGEPGPNTIQVLAGMGFKHHGVYFLPLGATVGDLVDRACLKKSAARLRHGVPGNDPVRCVLERRGNKEIASATFAEVQTPRFRSHRLSKGDLLHFKVYNF